MTLAAPPAAGTVRAFRPAVTQRRDPSPDLVERPLDRRCLALAEALAAHEPALYDGAPVASTTPPVLASVALVVRPRPADLELLLIKRAVFAGDPWSGHMAFPGGRRDPADSSSLETALRETREEVGVDLRGAGMLLGRLDDVQPRSGAPPVVVTPYVFAVGPETETRPNAEVDRAIWAPLRHLADPEAEVEYLHALTGGASLRFPAIGFQEHVIWGITHRIILQFLDISRDRAEQGEVT